VGSLGYLGQLQKLGADLESRFLCRADIDFKTNFALFDIKINYTAALGKTLNLTDRQNIRILEGREDLR
jgi:hypothetical protein